MAISKCCKKPIQQKMGGFICTACRTILKRDEILVHDTKILYNGARCKKCGDDIESKHRHDYVQCSCGAIAVDGGKDYLKRAGEPENFEERSIIHHGKI